MPFGFDDVVEVMARQGRTDDEWDAESYGFVKIQRLTAKKMLDTLIKAGYTISYKHPATSEGATNVR